MRLSADTTSNFLKALKALQSAGETIPAPAVGIVKCVPGIGITLFETAEVGCPCSSFILFLWTHIEIACPGE